MKSKKHLALLLALLQLTAMTACGAETVETADTAATAAAETEPAETELSDSVETVDYGGQTFTILARGAFSYEFDSELTGEVLDDAVFNRNQTVEERFNVSIVTEPYAEEKGSAANVLEPANNSILAGDDAYQLLAAYTYVAAPGSCNGNYINWLDMDHIDLDKPWWEKEFLETIALDGRAFIAMGDLSLLFNEVKMAIFFNKQLATDTAIPDLYATVREGKWTIDLLTTYASTATVDLNGDGGMDESDRWGIGANMYTHTIPFIYASGETTTLRDDKGLPTVINGSEKLHSIFEKVYFLFNDSGAGRLSDIVTAFPEEMFQNNQGLFMTSWIGDAATLREMEADFGIIPYPKWDEAQADYYTSYLDRTSSFLVPITVDADFVGRITEVLAAESYKQVIPAFYEVSLKGKYARDNDSQAMLDIITRNVVYDFGLVFAGLASDTTYPMIFRSGIYSANKDIASRIASAEKVYAAAVEKLVEDSQ